MVEILACDGLLERVQNEIQQYPTFNAFEITNNHLLQSICAEVLRLHVIVLITRTVKKPHHVNSWFLPKGQNITVSSNVEHFHEQWNAPNHPSTEFWPERFLNEEGKFSLEGRQAQWLPFGFGEHMCPGRHFAKQEMIINFVVLMSVYEIELLTPKAWRPEDSYARYGFGTQQPKAKVPFKIRRRAPQSS
jgi:cytochrome P450